jgi:quinol monooxygenase YgiN
MILVAGHAFARPEARQDAIAAMVEVAEKTRSEAGCIDYRFTVDLVDPNRFTILEMWESDDALAAHLQTEHVAAFFAKVPGFVAAPPDVRRYEATGGESLL